MAQVNATVGDLTGNADLIVDWTRRAGQQGAQVVVFPEMMLTGYPVEDLALRGSFVNASRAAVREVAGQLAAEGLGGIAVVTGTWTGGRTWWPGPGCRPGRRWTQPPCSTAARS